MASPRTLGQIAALLFVDLLELCYAYRQNLAVNCTCAWNTERHYRLCYCVV